MKKFEKLLIDFFISIGGWIIYFISFFFIKNPNKYLFGVHTSSFSGNVKVLFLNDKFVKGKRKIFIYKNKQIKNELGNCKKEIEFYHYLSLKGIWHTLTGKYYIYSSYPSDINFWTSTKAFYFNVWHGTPLKKIERDVDTGLYSLKNKYSFILKYIYPYLYQKPTKLLVSSQYEEQCFKTAFDVDESHFIRAFPPRLENLISKVYQNNKNIILYSPTWRDDHSFSFYKHINLDTLNDFMKKHDLLFFIKPHPSDKSTHIDKEYSHIKIISQNKDIYEIIPLAKLIITDYSSVMFEALYCNIPCFLFCPDIEKYTKNSRSFYVPITQLPFEIVKSEDTFLTILKKYVKNNTKQKNTNYENKLFLPYKSRLESI